MPVLSGADDGWSSTDNCELPVWTFRLIPLPVADVGLNAVTLTVTDVNGSSSTCTATVTVEDSVPPVMSGMDITSTSSMPTERPLSLPVMWIGGSAGCPWHRLPDVSPGMFDCSNVGPNAYHPHRDRRERKLQYLVRPPWPSRTACRRWSPARWTSPWAPIPVSAGPRSSSPMPWPWMPVASIPSSRHRGRRREAPSPWAIPHRVHRHRRERKTAPPVPLRSPWRWRRPTAVCQDITVQLDANGQATITAGDIDGDPSTTVRPPDTISASPTSFDCSDVGDNPVTLTVTDITALQYLYGHRDRRGQRGTGRLLHGHHRGLDANGRGHHHRGRRGRGAPMPAASHPGGLPGYLRLFQRGRQCRDPDRDRRERETSPPVPPPWPSRTTPIPTWSAWTSPCRSMKTGRPASPRPTWSFQRRCPAASSQQGSTSPTSTAAISARPSWWPYSPQDVNGNLSSCNATVTVVDDLPPVVECPVTRPSTRGQQPLLRTARLLGRGLATAADNCTRTPWR